MGEMRVECFVVHMFFKERRGKEGLPKSKMRLEMEKKGGSEEAWIWI
jgi:hypothetical protein